MLCQNVIIFGGPIVILKQATVQLSGGSPAKPPELKNGNRTVYKVNSPDCDPNSECPITSNEPANQTPDVNGLIKETHEDTLVFNYSNMKLTEAMDKLLNRGLNFSILPNKLDHTQYTGINRLQIFRKKHSLD